MKRLMPFMLFLLTLIACSKNPEEKPNEAPAAFQVSATNATGSSVQLAWTAAKDPEGGAVTYTVVVGTDTVSRKQTATSVALSNLQPNTNYSGSVVAADAAGNSTRATFSFSTVDHPVPSQILLSQESAGYTFFAITWTPAAIADNSLITYDVYLDGVVVATGLTTPGYRFEGLQEKTTYVAKVVAKSNHGKSSEKQMQFTTRTAPTAPTLTAVAGFSIIKFSFTPSYSPEAHWLQYELVLNGNKRYIPYSLDPNRNLSVDGIAPGSANTMYIRVVTNQGDTAKSNTVMLTTPSLPNFGPVTITEGNGNFTLSFDKGTTANYQSLALLADGVAIGTAPASVTTNGTVISVTYPQSAVPAAYNNRLQVKLQWELEQGSTTTDNVYYKYYNYTTTTVTVDRAFLTVSPYMQFNIIFTDHIISEYDSWEIIDVAFERFHYSNLLMPGLGAPNKTYITGNYRADQLDELRAGNKGYVVIKDASGYHKHPFTYTFQ